MEEDLSNPPAPKTITGIFAALYRAFDEAGKVASHHPELQKALQGIPQSDLDVLVQNVCQTYQNLEKLFIVGLAFESISPGILAKVTMQFGAQQITLAAPFDEVGSSALLEDLKKAVGERVKSSIILPH